MFTAPSTLTPVVPTLPREAAQSPADHFLLDPNDYFSDVTVVVAWPPDAKPELCARLRAVQLIAAENDEKEREFSRSSAKSATNDEKSALFSVNSEERGVKNKKSDEIENGKKCEKEDEKCQAENAAPLTRANSSGYFSSLKNYFSTSSSAIFARKIFSDKKEEGFEGSSVESDDRENGFLE